MRAECLALMATLAAHPASREVVNAHDAAFGVEGRVALWTKADSITRLDRVEIRTVA